MSLTIDSIVFFSRLGKEDARARLRDLAGEYMEYFGKHSNAVHLFPLRGTIFQYFFARGVADALHYAGQIQNRLAVRTITPIKNMPNPRAFRVLEVDFRSLKPQALKLKINEKPYVVHDYWSPGFATLTGISRAAGKDAAAIHTLAEDMTMGSVPFTFGGRKLHADKTLFTRKEIDPKNPEKVRVRGDYLTGDVRNSSAKPLKDFIYLTGLAATRELINKKIGK